ncbi:MAG: hypothetical protein GQ477_04730, partial [Nanohaloarchaea archaeon]|nr:hypothetical protein [Candidatus Nanohaloarchaea archaeon]
SDKDYTPFIDWEEPKQIKYIEKTIFGEHMNEHYKQRLIAAKTRKEHFPSTEEFLNAHYGKTNIN